MRQNEDGKTVRAMDILFPGIGEIVGGSQREERLELLKKRMNEMHIPADELYWYLDTRKFGTAPHAGFGLGFERLVESGFAALLPFDFIAFTSHLFGVTLMLSKKTSLALSQKMPALPCVLPMGSVHSISHSAGSASLASQALPRARVLPPGSVCTSNFSRYQVSAFQAKGLLKLRFGSICHERSSIFWMLPNKTNS